ncbi:hypothetical protein [Sphingobium sp. CCH11-B1]|jgi:hypothetical protein|uniref:Uncharacterized protein n=1 Tax=Sphingobium fluviale TaxID=2506423 RepID=A0A4Q1KNU5_9SPHN|nr:hypothetical protein [Sphingobium sp. CCH11-B1]RXR30899.1 hypothetical protein EQG66_01010 [Sphingobium fluviale]
MPSAESGTVGSDPAVGEAHSRLPVSRVTAQLSPISQALQNFRVVLTLHEADGSLYEAALTPIEASILVSEIANALAEGDRQIVASTRGSGDER